MMTRQKTATYVKRLVCGKCGQEHAARVLQGLCTACARPLLVEYDLKAVAQALPRETLRGRVASLWRYRELLPVERDGNIVTLGEGFTPLLDLPRLGAAMGLERLAVKDEAQMPTLSFKARGQAVAVSMAKELGVKRLAIPSAGNAASAMAAYGARAGLEVFVFMPEDVPLGNLIECDLLGAKTFLVNGLIGDCGKIVRDGAAAMGWFDVSTLKEPYRLEGKKTMGLEIAEQMDWRLPDVIIYPTGGGTGLVGMWKAFNEMEALGWIGKQRPRLVSVQAAGCAPIVRAFEQGAEHAEPWANAQTVAAGLRVPSAVGDFLILRAIRETGGTAIAVSDEELLAGQQALARAEGVCPAPEGGATVAALGKLLRSGWLRRSESVVLFNTGHAIKYPYTPAPARHIRKEAVDFKAIAEG
jgi:threonine synthase